MTKSHAYHLCYRRLHWNPKYDRRLLVAASENLPVAICHLSCVTGYDEEMALVDMPFLVEEETKEVEEVEDVRQTSLNFDKDHWDLHKHRSYLFGFQRHWGVDRYSWLVPPIEG